MRKLWLVIKREYLTRVRTKSFVIMTVALPALTFGYIFFLVALAKGHANRPIRTAVVDSAGGLAAPVEGELTEKLPDGEPVFKIVQTIEQPADGQALEAKLRDQIRQGRLDAFLIIPKDAVQGGAAEFHTQNPGDITRTDTLEHALTDAVISARLGQRGFHVDNLNDLIKSVNVNIVKITKLGESPESGQTFVVAIITVMVLYMTLVMYGVSTMRSVMEEKTTRMIEILVSSVAPFELLGGKILGVAAVALTQYLIWAVTGALVAGYGAAMASALSPGASFPSLHLHASLLVYVFIFFLGGYFLYSSLYAAVGSMVSSEQEAQQLSLPVTLPLVLSIILFNLVLQDPNSTQSVVLSMIPFFAPVLMLFRICLQTPPFWQIALSIGILVLTTIGVVIFSARIYRVGILMYGKRPSLVEILRWLRYT